MTGSADAGEEPATPVDERSSLAELCLRLGDDRLVLGHRLSELCGRAPILEEELATGNVALDLLGQAESLLALAGEREGRGRSADDLAYFREAVEFRSCLLVEQPNGDFARTMVRQFLFDAWDVPLTAALASSTDPALAAWAVNAATEAAAHLRHSREWVVRLGDGTDESRRRTVDALGELWRDVDELFETDDTWSRLEAGGAVPSLAAVRAAWDREVDATLTRAGLARPEERFPRGGGRRGRHGEGLGRMLAEMQIVARSFPGAEW